jgi:hypothetical protein
MFDQLFQRRAAQRRHLNSPLLHERLDYLRYRAGRGYKASTVRSLANHPLRTQNLLGLASSSKTIDPAAVEAAVKRSIPAGSHSLLVSAVTKWRSSLTRGNGFAL